MAGIAKYRDHVYVLWIYGDGKRVYRHHRYRSDHTTEFIERVSVQEGVHRLLYYSTVYELNTYGDPHRIFHITSRQFHRKRWKVLQKGKR